MSGCGPRAALEPGVILGALDFQNPTANEILEVVFVKQFVTVFMATKNLPRIEQCRRLIKQSNGEGTLEVFREKIECKPQLE